MLSPGLRPVYEAGTAGRPWVTHRQHWWGPGQGQPTGGLKEQSQVRRASSPSPKRESGQSGRCHGNREPNAGEAVDSALSTWDHSGPQSPVPSPREPPAASTRQASGPEPGLPPGRPLLRGLLVVGGRLP